MFDSELEEFKKIDLRSYAAAHGFQLDGKESWLGSAVMRHLSGEKIIIKRDQRDGHYVYFSVHDERDNGSIIDFCQNRLRCSLGAIRKELRPWTGSSPVPVPSFTPLQPTARSRMKVEADYARTRDAVMHSFLEDERALPASILTSKRFAGRVRIDSRANAVFPHFDADGLCGFELKNQGFTGFSTGGTKGLFLSHGFPEDNKLVFCESGIDALSYAVLFADERTRYASIGGKPNPLQPELARAAITRMPQGSEIVAAMDADPDGNKLAEIIRRACELTGRADLCFVLHEPFGFKDWNDQLRALPVTRFSIIAEKPAVA